MFNIFAFSVVCLAWSVAACPPREEIAPLCECYTVGGEYMMTCNDVLAPEDLIPPMRTLSMRGSKLFALVIEGSTLQYIPHGLFEGTNIQRVRFIKSEIMSLSDSDQAFKGLEGTLTEIRATEAEYIASWDWQQLKNLQNLEIVDVNQIVMGGVDEPFPRLPRLNALGITKAGLTHVTDRAFAELPFLRRLSLSDNEIVELKRNMLPDPADRLVDLDLSNNQLSHLPPDLFHSLPNLESVILDNNKFVILTEQPFSIALRKVEEFSVRNNPLRCDCRMKWLADSRKPRYLYANCTHPESLKGKSFSNLEAEDLWC